MRRQVGTLLIVFGAALLALVGATYARGALARERLRAEWDAREAQLSVVDGRRLLEVSTGGRPAPGAPVGRLLIPRLGLDEVIVEGVDGDALNAGPGHLPGSALPGAPGNAVVSAHRDRHFHALSDIAPGDTVTTVTERGTVVWVVTSRRVVSSSAPALFETASPTLTLTTCWPVRYVGPAPDRLIVTARPVDPGHRS